MVYFFRSQDEHILAVQTQKEFVKETIDALTWLFSEAEMLDIKVIEGTFIGPRREMITPWSTAAVEITKNMKIEGIIRIEEFFPVKENHDNDDSIVYDKMLQRIYHKLDENIFTIDKKPEQIIHIEDFEEYNKKEGLALSSEEIQYLMDLSKKLGRPLTDSEVFGFSQVNSEHCRHKIFNGTFIIDGKEMESSLFKMIKKTSAENPGRIVSAYKDNCAFIQGPTVDLFTPSAPDGPSFFKTQKQETVISMKAETHNFPTTVEPFNGAATGSGGEIRDRIAGGKGSFPLAGTAVYMTSYPRLEEGRAWEAVPPRKWLYQTPAEILIKASNGASDFGNKFGQPLICGSLHTMEHIENDPDGAQRKYGFDKVIMLAGGVGYAKKGDAAKGKPAVGDNVVLLGGDNYRIGMGGGAVSSVATGEYDNSIE
ncbi:MAG: phosphoribosylformylglycinamidine synthase, partial [Bacteroidales bacterium]|nr:phosphoribosylformylglycinamidine synthase [Bacteroidales bacterium]